jgi:hypothetical protein
MPWLRAEAGMCARRRSNFLLRRQKKVTKEKAAPSLRPSASLRATCDARSWGGVAELAAFFELRSNIRDEPDHEVRVSFGTRTHPRPCASRRSQQGWGAGTTRLLPWQLRRVSVTRCALPTQLARRPCPGQAQRGNWGRAKQWPVWSPFPPPSDRAEKRRAWDRRLPPRHRRGGHGQRGRLSLGYVSLATQRKVPRPPGRDPASALSKGMQPNKR